MINNFHKVNDHIYRGAAPSIKDIEVLKNKYNIDTIISLDKKAGDKIDRSCKLLDIKHIMLPIDIAKKSTLLKFLQNDIKKLLNNNGKVFIHCIFGRDRSGLAIALYRCLNDHWSCNKAWREALKYGLGLYLDVSVINLYHKLVNKACGCKKLQDQNSAYDIVENVREEGYDPYTLGENAQQSWSPYADSSVRTFPYANTYNDKDEQFQSRLDYGLDDSSMAKFEPEQSIPMSGIYDSVSGISGAGPFLGGSGYI